LETVLFLIPGYSEQLAKGAAPAQLLPCMRLLAAFEGTGPMPIAPKATGELTKVAAQRGAEAIARQDTRHTMNAWLWFIAVMAIIGVLLFGLSLVVPARQVPHRPVVGSR
jgi:hypothetical protein